MAIGLPGSLNVTPHTLQGKNKVTHKNDKNQKHSQQHYQQQQEKEQQATPQKIDLSKLVINKKQSFNLSYLEFIGQMNRLTIASSDTTENQ
ncbi:MAG: hypothetical protein H6Q72_3134 [Firmicutes bacterium]|nr:hypothetical protein [Bacillota bacterium]